MCPTEEQEVMDGRPPFRRRAHPAGEERVRRPSPVRKRSAYLPPRRRVLSRRCGFSFYRRAFWF